MVWPIFKIPVAFASDVIEEIVGGGIVNSEGVIVFKVVARWSGIVGIISCCIFYGDIAGNAH